jgi:hypothetical protein
MILLAASPPLIVSCPLQRSQLIEIPAPEAVDSLLKKALCPVGQHRRGVR